MATLLAKGDVVEEKAFGRYRLIDLLGQGGMGQVYRAHDTVTDRVVALKVLPPDMAEDHTFQHRFRREAHIAAQLSDPHVVPIHNYGEIDGRLYVDMRLIEGRDLGAVIAEGGPMNPVRAVHIIEQVAEALDAAHSVGLVHRDVKPSNILLARRDFVYLIDFGIARAVGATRFTSTGAAIGTLAYMAPERFDTGEAEPSSDIYALACVLHECLTGRQPFPGTSLEQQVAGHLTKPPPRPSVIEGVPAKFDEVIARGMAKNPGERFQTTLELADAARAALDSKPDYAPPPTREVPTQVAPTQPAPVWHAAPTQPPPQPPHRAPSVANPPEPSRPAPESAPTERRQPAGLAGVGVQARKPPKLAEIRLAGVLIVVAALMSAAVSAYYSAGVHGHWGLWVEHLITGRYDGGSLSAFLFLVPCVAFSVAFTLFGRSLLWRRGHKASAVISWLLSGAFVALGIPIIASDVAFWAALIVFLLLIALGASARVPKERYNFYASAAGLFGAFGNVTAFTSYPFHHFVELVSWLWIPLILVFGVFLYRSAGKIDQSPN